MGCGCDPSWRTSLCWPWLVVHDPLCFSLQHTEQHLLGVPGCSTAKGRAAALPHTQLVCAPWLSASPDLPWRSSTGLPHKATDYETEPWRQSCDQTGGTAESGGGGQVRMWWAALSAWGLLQGAGRSNANHKGSGDKVWRRCSPVQHSRGDNFWVRMRWGWLCVTEEGVRGAWGGTVNSTRM